MEHKGMPRRSAVRAAALLACPVMLSGCIFGFPFAALPTVTPTSSPVGAIEPSPTARADLPELPIASLPDAPSFAVWAPLSNARIRISEWRSGALDEVLVVPLLNHDPVYLDHVRVSIAPTGRYVAVTEAADGPTISRAFVRVFSTAGDLVWVGPDDVRAHPTLRWSSDGERLVVDAGWRWLVVTPRSTGTDVVEIDSRRAVPTGGGQFPWSLLDFSEDGRTLFGTQVAGVLPDSHPLASVLSKGGVIQPITVLPTSKGKRLNPVHRLTEDLVYTPIDPGTGRIAAFTGTASSTDPAIEIRLGTTTTSFTLPGSSGGPIDLVWQDGSLVILHDGPDPGIERLGVVSTTTHPGEERTVLSIPIVGQHGRLAAITDDFAILAFGRGLEDVPNRLLLVRLQDGTSTVIDADGDPTTIETFGFGGWLTSPEPPLAEVEP